MNREIKQKWIDSLRSGEYIQGKYKLFDEGIPYQYGPCHCVLGVLCDIYIKDNNLEDSIEDISVMGFNRNPIDKVYEWAGLKEHPSVEIFDKSIRLAILNDNDYTFDELSKLIEKQL